MDWTEVGAIATSAAAAVTAVSAVIIMFQTRATRKAAEAGESTAQAATASLELSRIQQRQTMFMMQESIKMRIDSAMPQISVTTHSAIEWPPLVPSDYGQAQPYKSTGPFRMPKDKDQRLLLRVPVAIYNDSGKTVSLTFNRPLRQNNDEARTDLVLRPDAVFINASFEVNKSVGDWVAIYQEREKTRAGGPQEIFDARYFDSNDTGAIETFRIVFEGSILKPLESEDGAWILAETIYGKHDPTSIGWSVQPVKRRYYLSRSGNLELPEIEFGG